MARNCRKRKNYLLKELAAYWRRRRGPRPPATSSREGLTKKVALHAAQRNFLADEEEADEKEVEELEEA
jgi:hypothetical protein